MTGRVVQMERNNNEGYISAFSILVMALLLLLTAAVLPRVSAELKLTGINQEGVEAQYAAEAGIKYTAAQILNKTDNTDWSWARGAKTLTFDDGETYIITIYPIDSTTGKAGETPISDGVALTSGNKYLIKSVGTVNGYSKTVRVIAEINGGTQTPAIYAGLTINLSNSVTIINGDIISKDVVISTKPTLSDGNKIYYYNSISVPEWMIGNQWYDGPLKDSIAKWSGEVYAYTADASTITSLPVFSAASNIKYSTTGSSLPSPESTTDWRTYYTLSAATYYVQSSTLQSDSKPVTFNKNVSGTTYLTINGNYTTNNSGTNYINLNNSGDIVLTVVGNMQVQTLVINAPNASNVTLNVTGNLTTSGSGMTINGSSGGNVNINVGGNFNVAASGITVQNMGSGSLNITVDGNYVITGYGGNFTRPTSGDVNILVNGSLTDTGSGLKILGEGTGIVNILVGSKITTSGAGIQINSSTGDVNIFSGSDLTSTGSGIHVDGANVKVVANGDVTFSGDNDINGDEALLYVIGEGHDANFSGSFTIDGSIIVADGNANVAANTTITLKDDSGEESGTGSGTTGGTIEFTDWSD